MGSTSLHWGLGRCRSHVMIDEIKCWPRRTRWWGVRALVVVFPRLLLYTRHRRANGEQARSRERVCGSPLSAPTARLLVHSPINSLSSKMQSSMANDCSTSRLCYSSSVVYPIAATSAVTSGSMSRSSPAYTAPLKGNKNIDCAFEVTNMLNTLP